jgi:putative addiction module killer protein
MEARERQLRIYRTRAGRVPYLEWFLSLRDQRARQKIQARIGCVRLGNLGQARSVGEGVSELKIDYGPGYRVYFGQEGLEIVILLCGGDKSSQDEDIKKAKAYWEQYKREKTYADH